MSLGLGPEGRANQRSPGNNLRRKLVKSGGSTAIHP
jgi:hypothetical protein